jgi:hypothetical protein
MRLTRVVSTVLAACGLVAASATVAAASPAWDQASGGGKTNLGASYGFVAQGSPKLNGNWVYHSADGSFSAWCHDLTSVQRRDPFDPEDVGIVYKLRLTYTCTDQDGNLVYLKAKVADHGEPGTNDIARIFFSHTDPNASRAPFLTDVGTVDNGNIQVFLR